MSTMPEQLSTTYPTLMDYQNFVTGARFESEGDWKNAYGDFIVGEAVEFLDQHGPGLLYLMPTREYLPPPDEAIRFGMADEAGDTLWFITDAAARWGFSLADATKTTLGDSGQSLADFANLRAAAHGKAESMRVITKAGLELGDHLPDHLKYRTLADNPGYIMNRMCNRLVRLLKQDAAVPGPALASDLEPMTEDPQQAIGEYLLALTYTLDECLDIKIEDVARFNIAKLIHRQQHGKANDIHFDSGWLS